MQERMARYDIRNDGAGAYAVFYCDVCSREFRSQPDVKGTIAKGVTRSALGGLFRGVPVVGDVVEGVGTDPRYDLTLDQGRLDAAWKQMGDIFHECPTCRQIVCPTDWDPKTSFCTQDSPRSRDIAEAQGQQAAAAVRGFANVFGLGDKIREAQAAQCANCGASTAGAKFCPECGTPVALATKCRSCGAEVAGAKFCPECGTKQS